MKITLDIYAEESSLLKFQNVIEDEYYSEDGMEYGCLSIENPERIGVEYELTSFEEWYVNFIEKYFSTNSKDFNIRKINLFIHVYYIHQCNFEIFKRDLMSRLSKCKYPIAFPISVYNLNEEQLNHILQSRNKSI